MTLITLTPQVLTSGPEAAGYALYFSPAPAEESFPTVWLDLHLGGTGYSECEDENRVRPFQVRQSEQVVRIRPRRGVRLVTAERVGVDTRHSAIVLNVASRAKHGLIVAPGKVDPGFNPKPLVLVVFNQSNRVIQLRWGEKIATLAFLRLSEESRATTSVGHAQSPPGEDFEPTAGFRIRAWLRNRDYYALGFEAVKLLFWAVATLALWYFSKQIGLRI